MDIEWLSSVPASAFAAALALVEGRTLVDPAVAGALGPSTDRLQAELADCGYPAEAVLREMIALAVPGADPALIAATALDKAVGRRREERSTAVVTEAAERLKAAFVAARPRTADELPLRIEPLRSQWEARGPGLLAGLGRLSTCDALLVPKARVVLVHPVLGGSGIAHADHNCVTFEGLLANPLAQLPEVLRLGWLLAQLNFDLPVVYEPLDRDRVNRVGPLALVPLVLAAAEDIELARLDDAHLQLALNAWLNQPRAAEVLSDWWQTYRTSRPSWAAALAALDALLAERPDA